ncbi:hypothetical protein [Tepidibacter aestuarii]|uniref:hypothetical protein n=1 Tax=Tepidibacter aestuarii TaxID=2925782 RepID=UPI0020C12133|nr:hypothetical protein [Tepidibacter aestuarii]CAH2215136.1 conserved exported protein of unknown function [Tepidibacter aestuarii]
MNKKVIKSMLIFAGIAFLLTFFITSLMTKEKEEQEQVTTTLKQEVNLMNSLLKKQNIKLSNNNMKDITIEEDYLNDFKYYIQKSEKIEKADFDEVVIGSSDDIKFSTDFNYIKIMNNDDTQYFDISDKQTKGLQILIDKAINTSFDTIKKIQDINEVQISYKDKQKQIDNIKEFNGKIHKKSNISEYKASKLMDEVKENFDINIKLENYEIYAKTLGKTGLGIYYKDYTAYYEIDDSLYNYLCDILFISKNDNESDDAGYEWVQTIKVEDKINDIEEELEGELKDELVRYLFSEIKEPVEFKDYEFERYHLKLKGESKEQDITVYENHIKVNDKYYKINGADLIVDSVINNM